MIFSFALICLLYSVKPMKSDFLNWVSKLHLQQCTFVKMSDGYCAIFVETLHSKEFFYQNSEFLPELYMGVCKCNELKKWKLCRPELYDVDPKRCRLNVRFTSTAYVHRRYCDWDIIMDNIHQQQCNCDDGVYQGQDLIYFTGLPTCDLLHTGSLCEMCNGEKCTYNIVDNNIRGIRCSGYCPGDPFCENDNFGTSRLHTNSQWFSNDPNTTKDFQVSLKCVSKQNFNVPAYDCFGPIDVPYCSKLLNESFCIEDKYVNTTSNLTKWLILVVKRLNIVFESKTPEHRQEHKTVTFLNDFVVPEQVEQTDSYEDDQFIQEVFNEIGSKKLLSSELAKQKTESYEYNFEINDSTMENDGNETSAMSLTNEKGQNTDEDYSNKLGLAIDSIQDRFEQLKSYRSRNILSVASVDNMSSTTPGYFQKLQKFIDTYEEIDSQIESDTVQKRSDIYESNSVEDMDDEQSDEDNYNINTTGKIFVHQNNDTVVGKLIFDGRNTSDLLLSSIASGNCFNIILIVFLFVF